MLVGVLRLFSDTFLINIIVADRRLTAFEVEVYSYWIDKVERILLIELHADLLILLHDHRRHIFLYHSWVIIAGSWDLVDLGVCFESLNFRVKLQLSINSPLCFISR